MQCFRQPSTFLVRLIVSLYTPPLIKSLAVRRQDVFGTVGEPASLIDRIADFTQAPELYRAFDKGDVGKIVFDPWK